MWPYQNGISHVWLGLIAALGGDAHEAVAQINAGLASDPENAAACIGAAWYQLLNREWAGAINLLAGVGGVSGSGIAFFLRGVGYAGLAEELKASGDAESATAYVDEAGLSIAKALKYEPDASWAADALCVAGWYYFQKEQYEESKNAFRKALEVKPGHKGAADAIKAMGG